MIFQSKSRQKQRRSYFQSLAPETFLQICTYLSPIELLSLSKVCKQFYNDLSIVETSTTITKIWQQSRHKFMPYRILGPPKGMNERDYIRLLIEEKCLFCGKKSRTSKIYWDIGVRACISCFKKRTTTGYQLFCSDPTACKILRFIPYTKAKNGTKTYWKFLIKSKINEYNSLFEKDRFEWFCQQSKQVESIECELASRWHEDYINKLK
ncbi:f-box domain contaning protein [Gigaspora margarita]|uniref:F-box domain contaning protein n=1 Tax=Gigaspora margarita TaxID=4874 RepID=A0A8H3X1N8_GIGMA|nr:f-box domain contaning protein [Gigaspora margarita]